MATFSGLRDHTHLTHHIRWDSPGRAINPTTDMYLTTSNAHNGQISMLPAGFKPTTLACERPQAHDLDRTATVISSLIHTYMPIFQLNLQIYRDFWVQQVLRNVDT